MTILTPYSKIKYKQAILKLLPKGKLWDSFKEEETTLNKIIEAYSLSYQQIDEDACAVIDEVFPGTTTNLLPIWQETVGLTASDETIKRQRSEVIAKLTQTASLAKAYYISYAKQLGFDIDITEYSGIISGLYRCGDSVGTCDDYTYQFDITITLKGSLVDAELSEVITYDGSNLTLSSPTIFFSDNLPTEDPNIKGSLWNNGYLLSISQSDIINLPETESISSGLYYNDYQDYVSLNAFNNVVLLSDLPLEDPLLNGQLWNNGTMLAISMSENVQDFGSDQDITQTFTTDNTTLYIKGDKIFLHDLPTDEPNFAGQLWNNGGFVSISSSQNKTISVDISKLESYLNPILPADITAYYLNI